MSDLLYVDLTYCTLCDRYFPGSDARRHHVQVSTNHPKCDTCNRRFANKNSLRNHLVISPRHNWCAVCEKDFKTRAGFRVHVEYAAVHRDDSDDDSDDEEIDDSSEGWEDELGRIQFPNEGDSDADEGDVSDESVDYWTDDENEDFEEELDAYDAFAPVPPSSRRVATTTTVAATSTTQSVEPKDPFIDQAASTEESIPAAGLYISCPLCLEAPKEACATKCGHLFCTSCIKTALSKKKMCPVCRDFCSSRHLLKIYLPGSLSAPPSA